MDRIALEWKCQKTFAVIYIAEQCVRAAMTHRAIESRAIAYCAGSCQKTTAQSHRSWRALSAPSRGRRPNYRRRTAVGVVDVASLSPMTSCPAAADRFPVPPRQIRLSPRRSAQSPRSHPVGCFHFRFRTVGRYVFATGSSGFISTSGYTFSDPTVTVSSVTATVWLVVKDGIDLRQSVDISTLLASVINVGVDFRCCCAGAVDASDAAAAATDLRVRWRIVWKMRQYSSTITTHGM